MIEDLQVRNYSQRTIDAYLRQVAAFARYFGKSPEVLGPEEVRLYEVHLLEKQVAWSTQKQAVAALRFVFGITLRRNWTLELLPYGKKPKRLPVVLSQKEVLRFLRGFDHPLYRMAMTTAYASGVRISELLALRPEHIDSERMMIHVELGKGNKSRMVPLSRVLLEQLRVYFLLHVLPKGFVRIRHFGWMANRDRKAKLARCRALLGVTAAAASHETKAPGRSDIEQDPATNQPEPKPCPTCKTGVLRLVRSLPALGTSLGPRVSRAPP